MHCDSLPNCGYSNARSVVVDFVSPGEGRDVARRDYSGVSLVALPQNGSTLPESVNTKSGL